MMMMKGLGRQYEHERAYVCVRLHVCVYFLSIWVQAGKARTRCEWCRGTAEGRADYAWESLHTCVSITGVWSVREHKCEAMLFQCAVTQCVLGFRLIPNLLFVIHPAWHQVLVTALPVPPGPWEEHSIPSKDRAY